MHSDLWYLHYWQSYGNIYNSEYYDSGFTGMIHSLTELWQYLFVRGPLSFRKKCHLRTFVIHFFLPLLSSPLSSPFNSNVKKICYFKSGHKRKWAIFIFLFHIIAEPIDFQYFFLSSRQSWCCCLPDKNPFCSNENPSIITSTQLSTITTINLPFDKRTKETATLSVFRFHHKNNPNWSSKRSTSYQLNCSLSQPLEKLR